MKGHGGTTLYLSQNRSQIDCPFIVPCFFLFFLGEPKDEVTSHE